MLRTRERADFPLRLCDAGLQSVLMKGFPNQVSDLTKLAAGMRVALDLAAAGRDFGDDGEYGPALVRIGVAGTGHRPQPIEQYIAAQRRLAVGAQSMRTSARGLRELYRYLDLIRGARPFPQITPLGRQAAEFAGKPFDDDQIRFWRGVVNNLTLGEGAKLSHPYQVMLRLVARRPGITRAKCALALEAESDSPEELDRVSQLSDLAEDEIIRRIQVSKSNWNNAKKVLPRFAEQLGDVIKTGHTFVLADRPGQAPSRKRAVGNGDQAVRDDRAPFRAPRSARRVTADTIGSAGLAEQNEPPIPPDTKPEDVAAAIMARADRLRRHNLIVRAFSLRLADGAEIYEDPFDILALIGGHAVLVEVKTLDGSAADERDRVRDALAQLLYYEAFVTKPIAGQAVVSKIACMEGKPSDEHIEWLNSQRIGTVWQDGGHFQSDELAGGLLARLGVALA